MDTAAIALLVFLPILLARLTVADLPGLFSGCICSSSAKEIIQPWCACKHKLNIDNNVQAWCKSYADFSQCVETSLQEQPHLIDSYLGHVFNKTFMDARMKYICADEDLPTIGQCAKETTQCHLDFLEQLRTNLTENSTCMITESLSSCVWTDDKCPVKLRHLLSRLSDSYTASRCTRLFRKSAGEKCHEIRVHLYPDKRNVDTCLEGVRFQVDCMNRESVHSEHYKDKFYGIDADRTNMLVYEAFRCENFKKHMGNPCFYKSSAKVGMCYKEFKQGETIFVHTIRQGKTISLPNVCSFFENVTECFQNAQPDCQPKADHLVALLCSAFPRSCRCPMQLDTGYPEIMFSRNSSSRSTWTFLTNTILVLVLYPIPRIMSTLYL